MENDVIKSCGNFGIRANGNVLEIDFSMYFSNGDAIPAQIFADGIIGTTRMLKESRAAFLSLMGIDNARLACEVLVDQVRPGSKFEDFCFHVLFGSDEEANATAEKLHQRLGVNKMLENKGIQNVAIAVITAYAISNAVPKIIDSARRPPMIEATNAIVLNAGRDLNIDRDKLNEILDKGIPNKEAAGKGAVMALGPAKVKSGTVVKFGGSDGIEISNDIIDPLPDPEDIKTEPKRTDSDYDNVEVQFVASDSDKRTNGWAVIMPDNTPGAGRRLPADLAETINPADLMYRQRAVVDTTIMFNKKGKAVRVLIRGISEPRQ